MLVAQMNEEGDVINIYATRHAAANATGIDRSSIRKAAKGLQKTAGGFKWVDVDADQALRLARKYDLIVQYDPDQVNKKIGKKAVVAAYEDSVTAGKVNGIKPGNIRYVIEGQRRTAGGYGWAAL